MLEDDVAVDRCSADHGAAVYHHNVERYRLAPVRDLRARDEKLHQGRLASAVDDARATQVAVDAAQRRVDDLRRRVAQAEQQRHGAMASTTFEVAAIVLAERHLAWLRAELDAAIGAHVRAIATHAGVLGTVDEARGRLAASRAHKEIVERHFARWRDERKRLSERRED